MTARPVAVNGAMPEIPTQQSMLWRPAQSPGWMLRQPSVPTETMIITATSAAIDIAESYAEERKGHAGE